MKANLYYDLFFWEADFRFTCPLCREEIPPNVRHSCSNPKPKLSNEERDRLIYERRESGATFAVVGRECGVSLTRAREIYLTMKRNLAKQVKPKVGE